MLTAHLMAALASCGEQPAAYRRSPLTAHHGPAVVRVGDDPRRTHERHGREPLPDRQLRPRRRGADRVRPAGDRPIPAELDGRYLRNGPNPIGPVDPRRTTGSSATAWCTACACATARPSGTATATCAATTVAARWAGRPAGPAPRHVRRRVANTNVIGHAGETCAIVEAGGLPVELSDELETIALPDFDGTLARRVHRAPEARPGHRRAARDGLLLGVGPRAATSSSPRTAACARS